MADRAVSFTFTTKDAQALAALKRLERGFKDLDVQVDRTRSSGLGLAGAFNGLGGLALGAGAALAVQEFSEAEKVAAKTEAVIRSTGGAAGRTAEQIGDLSGELGRMAALDDDVVQNAANVLATFTKIQGVNFDKALESALNLSAAFGTDLQSAAMQVGKALNDPIKGLTALSRAGVQFSADQKAVIRSLVETGDVAEAQRIILAELETQVGGAAAANATSFDRAKVAAGELAESLGAVLAPAVEVAADAAEGFASVVDALPSSVQTAAFVAAAGAAGWARWGDSIRTAVPPTGRLAGSLTKLAPAGVAAAAGVAAYVAATELIEAGADPHVKVQALADELRLVGEGKGDLEALAAAAGTSVSGLARDFGMASESVDGFAEGLGYLSTRVFSDFAGLNRREALNRLEELDAVLASMVDGGSVDEARTAFGELTAVMGEHGVTAADVALHMGDYYDALDRAERKTRDAADADSAWADTMDGVTDKLRDRATQLERINDATEEAQDRALAQADAELAYRDSVRDVDEAKRKLDEARASGDPAQIAQAEDDLTRAILDQADAAVDNARAQADLRGETLTTMDVNAIWQTEIDKTTTKVGFQNDVIRDTGKAMAEATEEGRRGSEELRNAHLRDVMLMIDAQRKLADHIKWNAALMRNSMSAAGDRLQEWGTGGLDRLGPPRPDGTTPQATAMGPPRPDGTIPRGRSAGITVVAPNLTRLGSTAELNAAMGTAGRALARALSVGG